MLNVQRGILPKSFWLACSGGVDSIAASHLLAVKMGYNVRLWHFNHKTNIDENQKMQNGVLAFGEKFGISTLVDINEFPGLKSEAALREARMAKLTRYKDAKHVVFCQHLDDAIESYIMNCFNGSPEYLPIPIKTEWLIANSGFQATKVIRPLLLTSKTDFRKYCENNDLLQFVTEDLTNTDQSIRRNWVRHRCRPVIEEHYPGIEKVVRKKIIAKYKEMSDDLRQS